MAININFDYRINPLTYENVRTDGIMRRQLNRFRSDVIVFTAFACQKQNWESILFHSDHCTNVRMETRKDDLSVSSIFKNHLERQNIIIEMH